MPDKIKLGISACLLGENVRYDGGHKLDRVLLDVLSPEFGFVPVCPEVECGMTVPREALRLVGDPNAPRLMTVDTGIDYTGQMLAWGKKRLDGLNDEQLCGFIFKSKSPSRSVNGITVFSDTGHPSVTDAGLWVRLIKAHFPLLAVEEDEHLHDPVLRDNFIKRLHK
ncbi:DUF523 domain-containing protein [Candidatus Latescibacterota bacterium]